MIEAYRVGITLATDVSPTLRPLEAMIQGFEKANKAIGDTRGAVRELVGDLRGAMRVATRLADELERVKRATSGMAKGWSAVTGAVMAGGSGGSGAAPRPAAAPPTAPESPFGGYLTYNPNGGALVPVGPVYSHGGPQYGPYTGGALAGPGGSSIPLGAPGGRDLVVAGPRQNYGRPLAPLPSMPGGAADESFFGPGERRIPLSLRGNTPTAASATAGLDLHAAAAGGAGAYGGYQFLKGLFDASAEIGASRAGLLTQGFTEAQVSAAYKSAIETQRSTIGTSVGGNLDLVTKLMAVTQDPTSAITLMPEFAKMGVVLNAVGRGHEGSELMDAIRAGEYRGVLSKFNPATGKEEVDTARLAPFLHNVLTTTIMSHGQVGPAQILQFMRSAGAGGRMIDDQSLFADSMALQMAMRSANAGTGIQGLQMQFSSGKMSEAAVTMLQEMGVLKKGNPKHNPFFRKLGIGQFLLSPDAYTDPHMTQMVREQPVEFAMNYMGPRLEKWVQSQPAYQKQLAGTAPNSEERARLLGQIMTATWQAIASRIPGGKAASEVLGNYPLIQRDREARMKLMGFDPVTGQRVGPEKDYFGIEAANNPLIIQQGAAASYKGFQASLGDAGMASAVNVLNKLSSGLDKMADFGRAHPDGMELVLKGLAAGFAALGTAAAVAAITALGTGGLLAGIGTAAVVAATGMEKLDGALRKWLPSIMLPAPGEAGSPFSKDGKLSVEPPLQYNSDPKKHGFIHNLLRDPFGALTGDYGPLARKSSYAPNANGARMQPISLRINLDGRTIANSVSEHIVRAAGRGASGGITGFDTGMSPAFSGAAMRT